VIRNIDEAIASVEGTRVFVDGVHHHGDGGDVRAVRSANYAISSFNLRAAAIAFSFGLGGFKSTSIKRRRASAVKVSVRSVPLLFPCLTRFVTINFNSLSFRTERDCERERTNTRSRETCFIADPSRTAGSSTALPRPLRVRASFARNDSCYDFLQGKGRLGPHLYVYCASTHLSDPVSLTATSERKMCRGLPSALPLCSVENRIGPAFL
jgi:hypothetical protein